VSFTGYKYYLVLIDDYSHYTWTFPLRNKFDATARIQNFHAYILNQFHLSIQCIQCDNGGEFINNTLNVTMVVSLLTTRFAPFFLIVVLCFAYLALTPLHKMARPSAPFAQSMTSSALSSCKLTCRHLIGWKP
jgi:hypothetical protein